MKRPVTITPAMSKHLVRTAEVYVREAMYGDARQFDPDTLEFAKGLAEALEKT